MTLIKPKLKDAAFLDDVKKAELDHTSFHLWWLGQSGFLIQWQGKHLLLDPYLSDSLTEKYADTDKPHIRMTELIINPAKLDFIDVVTSSHIHTDHLDAQTLIPVIKANLHLKLLIPEANRQIVAERLDTDLFYATGLNDGESVDINGFRFIALPAAHEKIERDEAGRCRCLSYVIQFGSWSLYHSGDTLWYEDLVERLKPFSVDVAFLPINGRALERRVAGNLNAKEAVALAKQIGAKIVIPHHYDMFTFNTANPDDFAKEAEAENQNYAVLMGGQRWSSCALQ
jgi:L-ascorbate metabolism protein UlaG (beta-lactamase superfamily)